jgi:hypothetical protein
MAMKAAQRCAAFMFSLDAAATKQPEPTVIAA